jgi:transcriptional regulator with XRE-family HTH domain
MGKQPKGLTPDHSLTDYFGWELRRHREERGLTQEELAEEILWARPTVTMLETASRGPTETHAKDLDKFFLTDRFGWLYGLIRRERFPAFFRGYVEREPEAVDIRTHEPLIMPGLFQTEAYAATVLRSGRKPTELSDAVAARMERQEILTRTEPDPPRVWALLDETVIRRTVGGASVMGPQLDRLMELNELYNVEIQIVPLSTQNYAGLDGAFALLSFDTGADIAYVEAARGGHLLEQQYDVAELALTFSLIQTSALPTEDSLLMIKECRRSLST